MLHEQTRKHILALRDSELVEYVLTGKRIYEPEAIAFARDELRRRNLTPEQLEAVRPAIIEKLARHDAESPPDPIRQISEVAILCDGCGLEVPNKYVTYHQNIGAIFVRFPKSYAGHYCRKCNHHFFRKSTGTTLILGWWGFISFFTTLAFLFSNLANFARSLKLPRVPADAQPPIRDEQAIVKISPHVYLISERLTYGAEVADIAREISYLADITPGQALSFVTTMLRNQAASRQQGQRGESGYYSSRD